MSFNTGSKGNGMQKLSILHVEASSNWDGQTIRILSELEGFQARGHAVALIAQPVSEIFKRAAGQEIPVEAVGMDRSNIPQTIWQVMRIIHNREVNIVHTHASSDHWIGAAAARLSRRRPIVIQTQHRIAPVKMAFVIRFLYEKFSDYVITSGENLKKQLIAKHSSLSDRIVSIPAGVDLTRFDPSRYDSVTIQDELGYTSGPRIAITGLFTNGKDFQDFVAAAAEVMKTIPEARFYIVETGLPVDVQRVREVLAQYRLQNEVFILGYREDIPQILSAMDLLIHCPSENSGLPQMVLQALAMGKPVVATKVGAIPEAVFDGVTGYLVSPRDVQNLADRVIDLLQDDLKRKAFGQAGRRLVKERYSLESMLDRLEQLYETLFVKRGRDAQ
jgi:glycosyltransferase involved in cell wall biosynthesis